MARLRNRLRLRRVAEYSYGTQAGAHKRTTARGSYMATARLKRFTVSADLQRQAVFLFALLVIGSVIGAVAANLLENESFGRLFLNVEVYISSGFSVGTATATIIENVVKYGKVVVMIWLMGFVPRFAFLSLFVILVQGVGIGFTTAILARGFGVDGIVYAAALYLPQNLILMPVYFYVAVISLKQAKKRGDNEVHVSGLSVGEYVLRLIPLLAIIVVVSCFEWAVTPLLFGWVS